MLQGLAELAGAPTESLTTGDRAIAGALAETWRAPANANLTPEVLHAIARALVGHLRDERRLIADVQRTQAALAELAPAAHNERLARESLTFIDVPDTARQALAATLGFGVRVTADETTIIAGERIFEMRGEKQSIE